MEASIASISEDEYTHICFVGNKNTKPGRHCTKISVDFIQEILQNIISMFSLWVNFLKARKSDWT